MRVLIVEDEPVLGMVLQSHLEAEAYAVDVECDGESGLLLAKTNEYDVIILDEILPSRRGSEICRMVRARGGTMPILLMSVDGTTDRKVSGLNDGADDYIIKPFSFEELSARLRALLRRSHVLEESELRIGDTVLFQVGGRVMQDGKEIHLTPKEFVLLQYLMKNTGRLVSRAMILEHVWNGDAVHFQI